MKVKRRHTRHPLRSRRGYQAPALLFCMVFALLVAVEWQRGQVSDEALDLASLTASVAPVASLSTPSSAATSAEASSLASLWPGAVDTVTEEVAAPFFIQSSPHLLSPTFQEITVPDEAVSRELAALTTAAGPSLPPLTRPTKVRLAIVIDDIGPALQASRQALKLPPPLTMAVLPYAERATELANLAHAAGHEVIVHMPMEPEDIEANNPGPAALRVNYAPAIVQQRLWEAFAAVPHAVGLNNHMGSRFTASTTGMRIVLHEIKRRGGFFLDSRTSAQSVARPLGKELGAPVLGRDIFLDNEPKLESITAQLLAAEKLARRRGYAIAIGHPYPMTVTAIKAWLPGARERGVKLVKVSELLALTD